MPYRSAAILLLFFVLAASAFALSLWLLRHRDDLTAALVGVLGVVALRAVFRVARVTERGVR